MHSRTALVVAALSVTLLAATGTTWWAAREASPRSDLVEPSPTTITIPSTTTTVPPTSSTTVPAEPPAESPPPRRLRIPELGIDSDVVPVALEEDGSMEVPGASEAGWYQLGAVPGSPVGSAVIAAHVDFGGRRGVFFELRRLSIGSEVTVVDDAGAAHLFRVVERAQFDKDTLPIPELFRPTGSAILTLITCGGAFDVGASSYSDNIVVRAVPV